MAYERERGRNGFDWSDASERERIEGLVRATLMRERNRVGVMMSRR